MMPGHRLGCLSLMDGGDDLGFCPLCRPGPLGSTGTITFTMSSGALPAGLGLDSSTTVVSGTPTSAGSATFTLTATNSAGTDFKAYTIVTTAAAITKTAGAAFVLASTGFDVLPWGVGGVLTLLAGVVLIVLEAKCPRSHAAQEDCQRPSGCDSGAARLRNG
jgi:hypothetical protein